MHRIKSVTFKGHPILGNLYLDFRGLDGKPVDTVIFAGENGTGKSTVIDAFNIDDFEADTEKAVVYLEGRTDEQYFKKATVVFNYSDLPFEFQWVGHLQKDNGQEEFTGASSLNQAVNFMKGVYAGLYI